MTGRQVPSDHERSAWLRERIAARLCELEKLAAGIDPHEALLATLTDPIPGDGRHDRTCDRCSTYVPPADPFGRPQPGFTSGAYQERLSTGVRVSIIVGWCDTCLVNEHGPGAVIR